MKIGIDVRSLAQGKNTGVEGYTARILREIFARDTHNTYVLFFNAWRNVDVDFSWIDAYDNVILKKYAIPNKLLNFSLWFFRYPKIDVLCGGVDAFFMPNNNFVALSQHVQLFLTVHDVSFEHCKNTFSLKRRIWHYLVNPRALMHRATHLFAVSAFTKKDVCATYDIHPKKVSVTPNGLISITGNIDRNSIELVKIKEKYHLPYKCILYFGTIEPRKNISGIIHAFTALKKAGQLHDYTLVIAGAHGWKSAHIFRDIDDCPYKDDIIVITDVAEKDKEALYVLSSVFVYPSLFEGFGFPPLEALACGKKVITSYTTSLPEVVKNHAIMIDPLRADELYHALAMVVADYERGNNAQNNTDAVAHTRRFTWDKTATEMIRAYETIESKT